MDYRERIEALRLHMRIQGIDALLLAPSSDLLYLTGVREKQSERFVAALIDQDKLHFVSPAFELANLRDESAALMTLHGWQDGRDPYEILQDLMPSNGSRIALGRHVPTWMTLALIGYFPDNRWTLADSLIQPLRMVKSEKEYAFLKAAQERSCRAYEKLLAKGLCGRTEREVQRLFVELSADEGVDSSGPMVASGPNTALPHHQTGDRVIEAGDVFFIDFGGVERQSLYRCDTTRTVAIKRASNQLKEIYDIVLEANHKAFQAAKPGVVCRDVDRAGREVIERAGYGPYFTHRLGHGLGLDVHEEPYLGPSSETILECGHVVSNEPGIYLPGQFGVRTEDILYIAEAGAEKLTPLPHDLLIVD